MQQSHLMVTQFQVIFYWFQGRNWMAKWQDRVTGSQPTAAREEGKVDIVTDMALVIFSKLHLVPADSDTEHISEQIY